MTLLSVLEDFHLGGAPEPVWQQRYRQLSPGRMSSRLQQAGTGRLRLYGKWMSERVVQQGCVPPGRLCIALLGQGGNSTPPPRAQGRELPTNALLVLHAGEEFHLQRPPGMELLSISFERTAFDGLLDAAGGSRQAWTSPVLQVAPDRLEHLRRRLRAALDAGSPASPLALFATVQALLDEAGTTRQALGSASASYLVAQCHRIVVESGAVAPGIDALCASLRTSRRSLQNAFQQVTGLSPVEYLRGLRLNLVRQRLVETPAAQLNIATAAAAQGFEQMSHFGARYKALFGELPSQTRRAPDQGPAGSSSLMGIGGP
ncbi:helix-turn-helix domain-containing protein [Paucibacter sp. R3-3]|uniref:Helix-turn-helix domain-containing protein n=1 Tax=Roseateles agri TaxID=3098619 RepID=A0ABU5DHV5_9BURK|nr:helix-turn-helix domain-containing protein [Paucibacter sp. R3-3]MDY0745866.1 helix-turn-helix domain-containing protein [Paucibacter sp. R3-3]